MKSVIILCILFFILSLINTVCSHSNHKFRLSDFLRDSMLRKGDTIILPTRHHKHHHSRTISSDGEQSDSMEDNKKEIAMQTRDLFNSEEDNYFEWASKHRRPIESLAGRKRSSQTILIAAKHGQIDDAIIG